MSFASIAPQSRQLGRFYGHFQASHVLLASPLGNDPRSSSSNMNTQLAMNSTANFSDSIPIPLSPTFAVIVLSLVAALMVLGVLVSCVGKRCLVSADVNSDAQRIIEQFKGLDREILAQFPIIKYQASDGDVEEGEKGLDCAVCLAQFQLNENVRLLPQCYHSFHPICIDKWLESNTTCPLCRTSLAHVHKSPPSLQYIAADQEKGEASSALAPMDEPRRAASAHSLKITSDLDQKDRKKEALLSLSRSSMCFKALQEMETQESAPDSCMNCENMSASRWSSKLRRSRSTESFRILQEGLWSGTWCTSEEPSVEKQILISDKLPSKESTITANTAVHIIDIGTDSTNAAKNEASSRMGSQNGNLRACRSNHGVMRHSLSESNVLELSLLNSKI